VRRNGQQSCNRSIMRRHGANEKLPAIPGLLVSESGSQRPSVVGGWSVNPRHAVFRLVPDGVISPVENTFRYHHREGLEALLKPVSQVRILPGAQGEMPGKKIFLWVDPPWSCDICATHSHQWPALASTCGLVGAAYAAPRSPGDLFTGIGQIDFRNTFRHHPSWLMDRLHPPDPQTVLESASVIDRLSPAPAAEKGLNPRALRRCRPREPRR